MSKKKTKQPTLTDQLLAAIESSPLSINALAIAADVPQPVLQRFASGERDIRLDTAAKLATYFGMKLTKPKG